MIHRNDLQFKGCMGERFTEKIVVEMDLKRFNTKIKHRKN